MNSMENLKPQTLEFLNASNSSREDKVMMKVVTLQRAGDDGEDAFSFSLKCWKILENGSPEFWLCDDFRNYGVHGMVFSRLECGEELCCGAAYL